MGAEIVLHVINRPVPDPEGDSEAGRLGGKTEVIFSCRFFNDKAYVVTFRRTDPLYALDLSDPENPIVTDVSFTRFLDSRFGFQRKFI